MKLRKPKDINPKCDYSLGFYAIVLEDGWLDLQVIAARLTVRQAKQMHNWLGRYIAWREQEAKQ